MGFMDLRTPQNAIIRGFRRPGLWVTAAALVLVSSGVAASGNAPAPPQSTTPSPSTAAPDDPKYPVFMKVCRNCHDADRVISGRRSRVEWEEVLDKMAAKGAQASDEEWDVVLRYLLQNVGRVYVNRCAPEELIEVLGLSEKDAAAIVAYRKDKGTFPDFDALAKVPGLDPKALEQNRDAIVF
jgi:competence protein ComEA